MFVFSYIWGFLFGFLFSDRWYSSVGAFYVIASIL